MDDLNASKPIMPTTRSLHPETIPLASICMKTGFSIFNLPIVNSFARRKAHLTFVETPETCTSPNVFKFRSSATRWSNTRPLAPVSKMNGPTSRPLMCGRTNTWSDEHLTTSTLYVLSLELLLLLPLLLLHLLLLLRLRLLLLLTAAYYLLPSTYLIDISC